VYYAEFSVDYYLPDSLRRYSIARTIRLAEVQSPGKPDEKEMPVGNDHGYMWRLNLYLRNLEKDNGVYIQVEFLALSRRVPEGFAWLVNPYLRWTMGCGRTLRRLWKQKRRVIELAVGRGVENRR